MVNIPFYMLIDEDSDVWNIVQGFSTLYPQNVENLDDEIIDNINENFYYRQIAFASPTKFLRAFHRLVKERAYTWHKMLLSERALYDSEMTRNYDLTEEYNKENNNTYQSNNVTKPNLITETTPNLETKTKTESEDKNRQMDTPDGFTADIDNYLSSASKDNTEEIETIQQYGNSITHQKGSTDSQTSDKGNTQETSKMHRYGKIGVQTAAQILGGYRQAQAFDVYEDLIFPEVSQLFLNVIDLEEVELY